MTSAGALILTIMHRPRWRRDGHSTGGRVPSLSYQPFASAFQTVVVVVLERLEGVLDVVRDDALVRLALVGRRRIHEGGLRPVQEPSGDVGAERHVYALALRHGD